MNITFNDKTIPYFNALLPTSLVIIITSNTTSSITVSKLRIDVACVTTVTSILSTLVGICAYIMIDLASAFCTLLKVKICISYIECEVYCYMIFPLFVRGFLLRFVRSIKFLELKPDIVSPPFLSYYY